MKCLLMSVLIVVSAMISGCVSPLVVRQQDLDAWVGMPTAALDTHSYFLTVSMVRTLTDSGIEIRNYVNEREVSTCLGSGHAQAQGKYVNSNTFSTCYSQSIECNNIFYIKDGVVLEYAPTGNCYTSELVTPQTRYQQLKQFQED